MDLDSVPIEQVVGASRGLHHGSELAEGDPIVSRLQYNLDLVLEENPVVRALFAHLESSRVRGVVFGGWARDHVAASLGHAYSNPRDIDIVIDAVDPKRLVETLLGIPTRQTLFGGLNFIASDIEIDLWPLHKTFMFERFHLKPDFNHLTNIADFTINAIVFKPSQLWPSRSVWESGCIKAISTAQLEFQYSSISFPRIQVARAIIYAAKLQLNLNADVARFLHSHLSSSHDVRDIEHGIRTYCPTHAVGRAIEILERFSG
ncbi:hypothetical protein V6Z72_14430 [Cereibacter sphaeroides]|uniref:hypothetical protein n=1 Tax=Cereibacter sphaeroides TaxID=1063 RepID=UPI0039904B69